MKNIHIAILGKEVLPIFYAIREYSSHIVYLLGTEENKEIANKLSNILEFIGCEVFFCKVSAFDICQIIAECERIHTAYSPNDSFIYNITGGTKLMAIGAYIVAQKHNSKVVYTNGNDLIDITEMKSAPLSKSLDNEIIFLLQNQKLKSFEECHFKNEVVEDAKKIHSFVCKHKKIFEKLMLQYRRVYNEHMPRTLDIGNIKYSYIDNKLEINEDATCVLNLKCDEAYSLLFQGRWWEIIVAVSIFNVMGTKYKIWHNVKFSPKNMTENIENDKNEVDILINMGNVLLFVECKSGKITHENIYKMDYVRNTYGSDKSKSVLISFYPVNAELREKAKDTGISVIAPINVKSIENFIDGVPAKILGIINKIEL